MKLAVYRSLWGHPAAPPEAARSIAARGYDGVEVVWPEAPPEQAELAEAVRAAGLGMIALLPIDGETPGEQLEGLRRRLEQVDAYDPERIVVHSGRDSWSLAAAVEYYERFVAIEAELGVRCAHETHRGRSLATPWATAAILDAVPDLRLCCDFSHWVVVCERLLEDQTAAIEAAARHSLHLHARVGNAQAAQLIDPADPANEPELEAFERWWEIVWAAQEEAGLAVSTLTPEYGPPPYQPPTAPPAALAAKLAEICDWQAARARKRFAGPGPCPALP